MTQSAVYRLADALEADVRSRPHYNEGDHVPYTLGYLMAFVEGIACRMPAFRDELDSVVQTRIDAINASKCTTQGAQSDLG